MRLRKKCRVVVETAVVGEINCPYTDWIGFSQRSQNKSKKFTAFYKTQS